MNTAAQRMTLNVIFLISSAKFYLVSSLCWSACKHCKQGLLVSCKSGTELGQRGFAVPIADLFGAIET